MIGIIISGAVACIAGIGVACIIPLQAQKAPQVLTSALITNTDMSEDVLEFTEDVPYYFLDERK